MIKFNICFLTISDSHCQKYNINLCIWNNHDINNVIIVYKPHCIYVYKVTY